MERIIFIVFLLFGYLAANAQNVDEPYGMKRIDMINKSRNEKQITVVAEVKIIFQGRALLASRNYGKTFITKDFYYRSVKQANGEWKRFETPLIQGREYVFQLLISETLRRKLHCAGCTGNLPAAIVDAEESELQAKRNREGFNNRTSKND